MSNNSNFSKKIFLIPNDVYERMILNAGENGKNSASDVKLKKLTQDYGQLKMLDRNSRNESLKALSNDLSPILTKSIQKGVEPVVEALGPNLNNTNLNSSVSGQSFEEQDILDIIESKISRNLRNKALQFYFEIAKLPDVKISTTKISVFDDELVGTMPKIIDSVIRRGKNMSYPIKPLLDKLIEVGVANKLIQEKVINNKEAVAYIKDSSEQGVAAAPTLVAEAPQHSSTPKPNKSRGDASTYVGDDEFSDVLDNEQFFALNRPGSGAKKWKMLIKPQKKKY